MDARAERRQVLYRLRIVRRLGLEPVDLRRASREHQVAERADVHADVDDDSARQSLGDAIFVANDDVGVNDVVIRAWPDLERRHLFRALRWRHRLYCA